MSEWLVFDFYTQGFQKVPEKFGMFWKNWDISLVNLYQTYYNTYDFHEGEDFSPILKRGVKMGNFNFLIAIPTLIVIYYYFVT